MSTATLSSTVRRSHLSIRAGMWLAVLLAVVVTTLAGCAGDPEQAPVPDTVTFVDEETEPDEEEADEVESDENERDENENERDENERDENERDEDEGDEREYDENENEPDEDE